MKKQAAARRALYVSDDESSSHESVEADEAVDTKPDVHQSNTPRSANTNAQNGPFAFIISFYILVYILCVCRR
jgi:hypothetical protein